METWASMTGVTQEIKEYFDSVRPHYIEQNRWEKPGNVWRFFGWDSERETIAYVQTGQLLAPTGADAPKKGEGT